MQAIFSGPTACAVGARLYRCLLVVVLTFVLSACGGNQNDSGDLNSRAGGSDSANFDCDGFCPNQSLSTQDVQTVLSNAILGAQTVGVAATFSVVDRVGNVLAVYQMDGAPSTTTINGQIAATGGLEGLKVPSTLAAISKAGTGAYLSSQGNAFTTRTASQIIQENFNPGETRQPGGPLFGVQFSQLPCSDVTVRNAAVADGRRLGSGKFSYAGSIGPRSMPLGLAGDPGGLPLYKQGDMVGGIGVEFDGVYRVDRIVDDTDDDPEERVALYATLGFEAPSERVAERVNVGKSLRYTDLSYNELEPTILVAPEVKAQNLVRIPEYTDGTIKAGTVFGTVASGVAKTTRAGVPAMKLVNPDGTSRYPTRAGSGLPGGVQLTVSEVEALLDSVLFTAFRTRAAIRNPRDTAARVSIWVIDHLGNPLGFTRNDDAPVFGIDVSLQKGRTAVFFSSADAGAKLDAAGLGSYANATRNFIGADALQGAYAFSDRAIGNLARPFFIDGQNDNHNGPLSLPFPGGVALAGSPAGKTWSPFNTGIQLDLSFVNLAAALGLVPSSGFPSSCASQGVFGQRLANGFQIFAGGIPLYRGNTLIGGIGISGDGIDQDDMIAFYGASARGLDAVGHTGLGDPVRGFNSPTEIRSDTIIIPEPDTRLRYVNCPEGPFSGSNDQNVCDGI